MSEDWLFFSPCLYGKRRSWKVVWANQKWGWVRVGVVGVKLACRHGGGVYKSYELLEALTL